MLALRSLDLSHNALQEWEVMLIVEMLGRSKTLTSLNLSGNKLGVSAGTAMAKVLRQLWQIRTPEPLRDSCPLATTPVLAHSQPCHVLQGLPAASLTPRRLCSL